ncbi:glutaminase [Sphingobium boeckii]|uniref:Glutaminase n=1 Tax=Sphingobium boeckii TaxID=1082345 RepID=A0A7W9AGY5_9SPHN|nr:glutaminase [Sphingobium boeckii]MBB5685425.1 glutaminase [Sphingobium boeckii]
MDIQRIIDAITAEMTAAQHRGKAADYIPALARVDPAQFGIAVVMADGRVFTAGDARTCFSIQSISKVFALSMALGKVGADLWTRVGREPSGSAFNSVVQLEHEGGIPRNPFINAGAIVVSDVVLGGGEPRETIGDILRFLRYLADDDEVQIDQEVASSEAETGFRNIALANYMKSFGNMHNVESALKVYFHQCALSMTCLQLAMAGRYLVHDGKHPGTGRQVVTAIRARRINALMLTCGHYDGSGEFAFRVGIPGKSGVGGGIIAIVPGEASIAVWSPGLNDRGNSLLGSLALERLSEATGWSVFNPPGAR